MATVTEKVKETLVGTEEEEGSQQLSAKREFLTNCVEDEATGEQYLDEKAFINAVAPEGEDYVSSALCLIEHLIEPKLGGVDLRLVRQEHRALIHHIAQDQARAVLDPVQHCRPPRQRPRHSPRLERLQ